MVKRVQFIGHITAQANQFTGREREITVDTTTNELRVHNGATAGGKRILTKEQNDLLYQALGLSDFVAITVDTISEHTGNNGVNIEGVPLKDGLVDGVDVSVRDAFLTAVNNDLTTAENTLASHVANVSNPHAVTKTQIGLSAVTNDAQLKIASNLADLNNVATARTNLGLGALATLSAVGATQITDLSVGTAELANDAVTFAKMQNINTARVIGRTTAAAGSPEELSAGQGISISSGQIRALGPVAQIVQTELLTVQILDAGNIPNDDTIPQITEGEQFLSRAITPTNAGSTLVIEVTAQVGNSTTENGCIALFQVGVSDALRVAASRLDANWQATLSIKYVIAAGSTTARTYTVRGGSPAGNMVINGIGAGTQKYGGRMATSIVITEYLPTS